MKIIDNITDYIVTTNPELSFYEHIDESFIKENEKLLLRASNYIEKIFDIDGTPLNFESEDIEYIMRIYYFQSLDSLGLDTKKFNCEFLISFKQTSSCGKQGFYRCKIAVQCGNNPEDSYYFATLKEKLALSLDDFIEANGLFLCQDEFNRRYAPHEKFINFYYDVIEPVRNPKTLVDSVIHYLLNNSALFSNFKQTLKIEALKDRTDFLEIKHKLAEPINKFSLASLGLSENGNNFVLMKSKIFEVVRTTSQKILYFEEFQEPRNNKSRYFRVQLLMQNTNGVFIRENPILKINNADESCAFCDKAELTLYPEETTLVKLNELLDEATSIAIYLLPKFKNKPPLAKAYQLAIGTEEDSANNIAMQMKLN